MAFHDLFGGLSRWLLTAAVVSAIQMRDSAKCPGLFSLGISPDEKQRRPRAVDVQRKHQNLSSNGPSDWSTRKPQWFCNNYLGHINLNWDLAFTDQVLLNPQLDGRFEKQACLWDWSRPSLYIVALFMFTLKGPSVRNIVIIAHIKGSLQYGLLLVFQVAALSNPRASEVSQLYRHSFLSNRIKSRKLVFHRRNLCFDNNSAGCRMSGVIQFSLLPVM